MLASFYRPARRELVTVGVIIALALGLGRWFLGSGGEWTWLAIFASAGFFLYAAAYWPALHALDVPARRWLGGALGTAALWSLVMTAVATTTANLMQARSPYYAWYDWFLATSGPFHHLDTNGEPYTLNGLGITLGSVSWTFLITFVAFFAFTLLGLAVGVAYRRRKLWIVLGAAAVIALIVLYGISLYLQFLAFQNFEQAGPDAPGVIPIQLAGWGRFGMLLAILAVPTIAAGWVLRRGVRTPWG